MADTPRRKSNSRKTVAKPIKLSHTRRPEGVSTEAWQRELRRQFGREQDFGLENLGADPVFSEFRVTNPASGGVYRVAIRGAQPGDNHCTCPDFTTNELGTCKHVEFVLGRLERLRGGSAALRRGSTPPYSEIYLRYGARRVIAFRPGADCPAALLAAARESFDEGAGWMLRDAAISDLDRLTRIAAEHHHALRINDDAVAFEALQRDALRRSHTIDRAFPKGAADPALRRLLREPLHPYQADGALFAARSGRCLIGDEMGLGKTVQAIAAAEILRRHWGIERVLVICPTSLKHQWKREIERFIGAEAQVIAGLRTIRARLYVQTPPWRIVNYEMLHRDLDLIAAYAPDLLIVDEAQRVKNWNTIAARALRRIESPHAFVLTGTPLENRLEELIAIVQLVDRHRLGPTWRLLDRHQVRDAHGRVVGYKELDKIGETLAPVVIRRRKAQVLDQLPKRMDSDRLVPMTDAQRRHHQENADVVAQIVARWRRTGFLSDADQKRLTCCLQNMRMSCNSTYLLDGVTDHGVKADELAELFDELFADPDEKAVVFSQWVRTHEIVARRLEARGIGYVSFHGGIPGEHRGALIDRFRDDPSCRVFLSTDAGGVGLNLQHASNVINMDLPWNPAVLEQRIGRVYRMGQRRPVRVVNFIAEGTIEEAMLSVLAFKKALFAGVLDGEQSEVFLDGSRLKRFMETVERVSGSIRPGEAEAAADIEPTVAALPAPAAIAVEVASEKKPAGPARAAAQTVSEAGPAPDIESAKTPAGSGRDPLATLLEMGAQLLGSLAQARSGEEPGGSPLRVERDPGDGRAYVRFPMPEPETLERVARALRDLFGDRQA